MKLLPFVTSEWVVSLKISVFFSFEVAMDGVKFLLLLYIYIRLYFTNYDRQ
jgi:hypothetical protein